MIKFKNHFVKIQNLKTLPSPLYSVIYNAIPSDKLMAKDDLVETVLRNKEVKESVKTFKGAATVIEELVKLSFLKEISGSVLEVKLAL